MKKKIVAGVGTIWLLGLFLRVYRQGDLLGFYYDQGRDALQVAKILSLQNLPAIGPTTGLQGIFLGPFWYYLLAPFYWLAKGDPAIAAGFIGLIDALAIPLFYFLGKKFFSARTGILAAFFWAGSYWLVRLARWFSNPSPLPFFSLLLIWGLAEWLINQKRKGLVLASLALAISLQLEAASAVFYFPVIIFSVIFFQKQIKRTVIRSKEFFAALAIFSLSLLPQLLFELKNNFLISRNFLGFLTGKVNSDSGQSWALPSWSLIRERLTWYNHVFFSLIDPNLKFKLLLLIFFFLIGLVFWRCRQLREKEKEFLFLLLIFWLMPLFFLFFFVGNYGNLYDYYLTGFFVSFIFLFAYFLSRLPWLLIIPFLIYFIWQNGWLLRNYLIAGVDGPEHISLGNQKQVIEWICRSRGRERFNVDTYVPPVVPYAWDYLWQWYGKKMDCLPASERQRLLYTVWEVDPPRPERLRAWLERQAGIGTIKARARFGGIGVEQRERKKK